LSSIHLLVNSSNVETFEEDFAFTLPDDNDTQIDTDTDAENGMEIYETPPNLRRLDISPETIPRSFHSHSELSSLHVPASPVPTSAPTSPFQSFRLTSEVITEVVQSPPNGRRFRLTKDGIKEISSTRNGFCEFQNMAVSPNSKRIAESPSPSAGRRSGTPSASPSTPGRRTSAFTGMPGAVPPVTEWSVPPSARTTNFLNTSSAQQRSVSPFAGMPGAVAPIPTRNKNPKVRNQQFRVSEENFPGGVEVKREKKSFHLA